jgi:calcium binding protein 39
MFEGLCEQCLRGKATALVTAILNADAPARIFEELAGLDFEDRKTFAALFADMLDDSISRQTQGSFSNYLQTHPHFISQLLDAFGSADMSLHCSVMLQACARDESLAGCLLQQKALERCIELAEHSDFDISCEAFALLRELLSQKVPAAAYLDHHAEAILEQYKTLLESKDYTKQRQALKQLGCVLLQREFSDTMQVYVQDIRYLKLHMNLLLSKSPRIQHDNFHIFKVFVANPWKSNKVVRILLKNRVGLMKMLENYRSTIDGDDAFMQDLAAVLKVIEGISEAVA